MNYELALQRSIKIKYHIFDLFAQNKQQEAFSLYQSDELGNAETQADFAKFVAVANQMIANNQSYAKSESANA